MNPVVHTREVICDAKPATVWALITDTNGINRLAGLPAIQVRTEEGRTVVTTSFYGVDVEYEERPFEWVEGEHFSILRRMRSGPLQSLEMMFRLRPRPDGQPGTLITLRLTLQPASLLFVPVAKLLSKRALSMLVKALSQVDEKAATGRWRRVEGADLNQDLLNRSLEALEKLSPRELVERLAELLKTAADTELDRLRPFDLAKRWSSPRRAVLTLCLNAVLSGLLDLRWDLVCPSCRTTAGQLSNLSDISEDGHCDLCDIRFDLDLDRSVEATFRPATAIRKLEPQTYCVGGPARTPHVIAQAILEEGRAKLEAPEEPGRYRVFLRGGAAATLEVTADGPAEVTFTLSGEASAPALSPVSATVGPRGVAVVTATDADGAHAKLERLEWASLAATAHYVTSLATFRRQFSQQVLRPGLSLKVGRVAILFSDLTGSTELYTRVGDAIAFRLVQEHFDLLFHIVEEHDGSVIKTIGDAVMAGFLDEAQAVRAGVAMLRAFPSFAAEHEHGDGLSLKLGAYSGACYAVTANDQLDYFGQSVNVAARLQGQARGAELILAEDLAERAQGAGWLVGATLGERYAAALKGVGEPIPVVRITADA